MRKEEGDLENIEKTGKEKNSYTDVLPSVLLKYELSRNTQVKAAWSNTIARPRYFDLVPYTLINREDQAISIGNPELDPTYSMNFDLMIEHYFSTVGLLSGGFFYKNIEDFIVPEVKDDYDYLGETWDEFSQPVNAGNADLWGIELAFHRQLDFLPGILKNFGLYTNYTYTRSEVSDFRIAGREDEKMALPGTPENNFNVSLYYDDTKFSARLSFNHAGDFIDEIGGEAFEDRYYDKASHLDFNASYAIHPKFFIFTEINNLLNTPLRYYQGTSRYTMQEEYYNTRLNLGLKFEF
jgi:TonB-dependent receptor